MNFSLLIDFAILIPKEVYRIFKRVILYILLCMIATQIEVCVVVENIYFHDTKF